jgi:hypothetical protein
VTVPPRSDPITPELVLKWLHAIWPKMAPYTNRLAFWHVVNALRSIRDAREMRKAPPPIMAPKYARLFVRHAPRLLAHIDTRAEIIRLQTQLGWIKDQHASAGASAVVEQVDEAVRMTQAAFDALNASGLMAEWRPAQPERFICHAVQEAWRAAAAKDKRVRVPQSKNPNDPLCRFVQLALAEIGMARELATISSVLRGRRR